MIYAFPLVSWNKFGSPLSLGLKSLFFAVLYNLGQVTWLGPQFSHLWSRPSATYFSECSWEQGTESDIVAFISVLPSHWRGHIMLCIHHREFIHGHSASQSILLPLLLKSYVFRVRTPSTRSYHAPRLKWAVSSTNCAPETVSGYGGGGEFKNK